MGVRLSGARSIADRHRLRFPPKIFTFSSPPTGATCAEAADHLRREIPGGFKQVGKVYFHASPPEPLNDPRYPIDYVVFVDDPEDREEFLAIKRDLTTELDAWLKPTSLTADDYRIVWGMSPIEFTSNERDPATGRLVRDRLTGDDQISGSPCAES